MDPITYVNREAVYASKTTEPNFINLMDSRGRVDHILMFQPKKEQDDVPTIEWYDSKDIVYVRKGTEIKELTYEGDISGYELTYKGKTHKIFVETSYNEDLQFQEIKKKFFKEENIKKFIDKYIDEDGNAQAGSGERGLTIMNVRKKDMWEIIQDDTECLGKQIVFKGTGRDDVLIGNNCNNVLIGRKGDDILDGGGGDDFLVGGSGRDTFVYSEGNDVIVNFDEGEDRLDMGNLEYGIDYMMKEFENPLGGTGVKFIFADSVV